MRKPIEKGDYNVYEIEGGCEVYLPYSDHNIKEANEISYTVKDIPVIRIGKHGFDGCPCLTSIIIPDGVTEIGAFAFNDCVKLSTVIIPGSVKKIEVCAFGGCTSLKEITIPGVEVEIESYAFEGCVKLSTVNINTSKEKIIIEPDAFPEHTSITCLEN